TPGSIREPMRYEGYGRTIFNLLARSATSNKSDFQQTIGVKHAILVLYVSAVGAGSITDINVYLVQPGVVPIVANAATPMYQFSALGINTPGTYAFGILPGGFSGNIPFKTGSWPTHWEIEVKEAGGSNITWSLEAQWIY